MQHVHLKANPSGPWGSRDKRAFTLCGVVLTGKLYRDRMTTRIDQATCEACRRKLAPAREAA